jgi:hypothetical protein
MNLVEISNRVEIRFWSVAVNLINDHLRLRALKLVTMAAFCLGLISIAMGALAQFRHGSFAGGQALANEPAYIFHQTTVVGSVRRQSNTLVILVDQIASGEGSKPVRIRSIWLAAYLTSTAKLSLAPVYPGGSLDEAVKDTSFHLGHNGTLGPEFFQLLQSIDVRWDHYVVMETATFQELMRLIIGGEESLSVNAVRPEQVVAHQAAQVYEICHHVGDFLQSRQTYKLIRLFDRHIYSDLTPEMVLELWQQKLTGSSRFSCEFPTLGEVRPVQRVAAQ